MKELKELFAKKPLYTLLTEAKTKTITNLSDLLAQRRKNKVNEWQKKLDQALINGEPDKFRDALIKFVGMRHNESGKDFYKPLAPDKRYALPIFMEATLLLLEKPDSNEKKRKLREILYHIECCYILTDSTQLTNEQIYRIGKTSAHPMDHAIRHEYLNSIDRSERERLFYAFGYAGMESDCLKKPEYQKYSDEYSPHQNTGLLKKADEEIVRAEAEQNIRDGIITLNPPDGLKSSDVKSREYIRTEKDLLAENVYFAAKFANTKKILEIIHEISPLNADNNASFWEGVAECSLLLKQERNALVQLMLDHHGADPKIAMSRKSPYKLLEKTQKFSTIIQAINSRGDQDPLDRELIAMLKAGPKKAQEAPTKSSDSTSISSSSSSSSNSSNSSSSSSSGSSTYAPSSTSDRTTFQTRIKTDDAIKPDRFPYINPKEAQRSVIENDKQNCPESPSATQSSFFYQPSSAPRLVNNKTLVHMVDSVDKQLPPISEATDRPDLEAGCR